MLQSGTDGEEKGWCTRKQGHLLQHHRRQRLKLASKHHAHIFVLPVDKQYHGDFRMLLVDFDAQRLPEGVDPEVRRDQVYWQALSEGACLIVSTSKANLQCWFFAPG